MPAKKPVFLASDVHLGAIRPDHERAFLEWLEHAAAESSWILLNGDLFDFWFEYRNGIPKGYEHALTALKRVAAEGPPVTLMGGNHDWWGGAYLRDEIGIEFLQEPVTRDVAGRRAFIAHGDGLGDGDTGYKVLKWVLRSRLTLTGYGALPVDVGDAIAKRVSHTEDRWDQWGPKQQERSDALERYAVAMLEADPELGLVLMGHTHLPLQREVGRDRWYVNSGDWVFNQSYVVFREGSAPELLDWKERDR